MIEVPDETFYFLLGHYLLSKTSETVKVKDIFKIVIGALVWYFYVNPELPN